MTRVAVSSLFLLLAGSPVPAYLVRRNGSGQDLKWDLAAAAPNVVGGKVTYYVDEASAEDVTGPEFGEAVRDSVEAWEDVEASSIAFLEDQGRPATRRNASDRINRFGYSAGELPVFAFAAAFTSIKGTRITDVDVVFNPDFTWSVQTPGHPAKADVQSVSTHEWGHGIGLDHVPLARSTMYFSAGFGQISLRTLEIDDAAGAARSYPADDLDDVHGRIRGTVSVTGTADERGVHVVAIDFVTGLPAASTLTETSGQYEILGLPPGVYRLVAGPIGTARVEGGAYSPYWGNAATGIHPAVRGEGVSADGSTGAIVLAAGQLVDGADLSVATTASPPGEPDGTIGLARSLPLGRSAAARIETDNDHDFYAFSGVAGRTVSVFVHAGHIGSDLDPRVYLRAANGVQIAFNDDISADDTGLAGPDSDCRILDFTLPTTGTYYVEVEPESSVEPDQPEDFSYVVTVLEGGVGQASPYTSTLSVQPSTVPADGVSSVNLVFRPLTIQATPIGGGQIVSFDVGADGDADGSPSPAVNQGDGTWTGFVTAPVTPGRDTVRALVDGVPVVTAAVAWRGPADGAASDFFAEPRRIRSDGSATAQLYFRPRDAQGVDFGPGHDVGLDDGGAAAGLGPVTGLGNLYTAILTAGALDEDVDLAATVDGVGPLGPYPMAVGFPLEPVLADAAVDLDAALVSEPPPPLKAAPRLAAALARVEGAFGLEPLLATASVQKAIQQLEAAGRKGADASLVAGELAESVRQAAREAIDGAVADADTTAEQALLTKAETQIERGDVLLDGSLRAKAAAKYRAALKLALRVQ